MADGDVMNDTVNTMIEDKVTTMKEELEELIEEVKNEVDDRGTELETNRDSQTQSFNKLNTSMDKLRKELKQFGISMHFVIYLFSQILNSIFNNVHNQCAKLIFGNLF